MIAKNPYRKRLTMQFPIRTKNITKIMAKDASRYAMHQARLVGSSLVATNGYSLVKLPVTLDEHDVDGIVTKDAIVAACKGGTGKAARGRERVLLANGDLRAPFLNYVEPRPDANDASFPKYDAAIPTFRPGDEGTVTLAFNAQYLADLAACLSEEGEAVVITVKLGRKQPGAYITDEEERKRLNRSYYEPTVDMTKTDGGPMLVHGKDGPGGGLGVLMPITID